MSAVETGVFINKLRYETTYATLCEKYGKLSKAAMHRIAIWHVTRIAMNNNLPVTIPADVNIPYNRCKTPDKKNSIGKFRHTVCLSVTQKRFLRNTANALGTSTSGLFDAAIEMILSCLAADPALDEIYKVMVVVCD